MAAVRETDFVYSTKKGKGREWEISTLRVRQEERNWHFWTDGESPVKRGGRAHTDRARMKRKVGWWEYARWFRPDGGGGRGGVEPKSVCPLNYEGEEVRGTNCREKVKAAPHRRKDMADCHQDPLTGGRNLPKKKDTRKGHRGKYYLPKRKKGMGIIFVRIRAEERRSLGNEHLANNPNCQKNGRGARARSAMIGSGTQILS